MRLFLEACHFPRSTSAGSKDMDIPGTYYSLLTIVISCFAANSKIEPLLSQLAFTHLLTFEV